MPSHLDGTSFLSGGGTVALVGGVDTGSLNTLSYVAWLAGRQFLLDLYQPAAGSPLPVPPPGWGAPVCIAFDAPQGLPVPGELSRRCDREANAPTRRLPVNREELARSRLYKGLIEAGIEIFWAAHERGLAVVAGLGPGPAPGTSFAAPAAGVTVICETYPRLVIRRLWPDLAIPSKRHSPLVYIDAVWGRIRQAGYTCPGVARPTVDQVDAMLCALAAAALVEAGGPPPGTVGAPPVADPAARVLREGYVISP